MAFHLSWFPFYHRDFFESEHVRLMTREQRCMYLELLAHQWVEGSLPSEPHKLAMILHLDVDTFAECWPSIKECFVKCEGTGRRGRLINLRLEDERIKAIELYKDSRCRGLYGADVKRLGKEAVGSFENWLSQNIHNLPNVKRCLSRAEAKLKLRLSNRHTQGHSTLPKNGESGEDSGWRGEPPSDVEP